MNLNKPDRSGDRFTVTAPVYNRNHLGSAIEEAKRITMRNLESLLTDGTRYAIQINVSPPEEGEIEFFEKQPYSFGNIPTVVVHTHLSTVHVERLPVLMWEHVGPMGGIIPPGSVMTIDRDGPYKKAAIQFKEDAGNILDGVDKFFDSLFDKRQEEINVFCGREKWDNGNDTSDNAKGGAG